MMIRGLCFGAGVLVLVGAASGGCSSSSTTSGSSSGSSGSTSGSSGSTSGASGTSSGTSGTSSGTSGTSSGTSGASSGTSGASSGTSGSSGDAGKTVSCATYCTTVNANCTGANIDYVAATNAADCTKACGFMTTQGTYGDALNSVGCRQYHSDLAAGAGAGTHCPHAGMFGGGACGDKCDDFCTVAVGACPNAYADKAACVAACANWQVDAAKPIGPAWTGTGGGITGVAAEGYNCRSYHLSVALTTPQPHCDHIKANSTPCK